MNESSFRIAQLTVLNLGAQLAIEKAESGKQKADYSMVFTASVIFKSWKFRLVSWQS